MLPPDFKDILSEFIAAEVDFIVVGAYALAAHSLPRATGDINIWMRCAPDNAMRVIKALKAFGTPLFGTTAEDFATPEIVLHIGVPPYRIDILTQIDGVDFAEAWAERIVIRIGELDVNTLGYRHLLQNKETVGRPKDLLDAQFLRETPPALS